MSNTDKYRTRLINLLKELFQLDQPELDFGFYKIMHAKSVQISRFLEDDLLNVIKDAFGEVDDQRLAEAKAHYEAAIEQAKKFGAPDPEQTDGVKEAKAQYEQAKDGGNAESEIYDHLYRFFERYYDNGDFMSRRYYARESDSRAAPYAVPYDGREVYLHWANKDQYYIKSSEYLSNYSFDLNEAIRQQAQQTKGAGLEQFASHDEQPLTVHFRIADANEGEHGNIKAASDQKRFFLIHAAKPVELLLLPSGVGQGEQELVINFEYRIDPDKTGQDNKWQETRLKEAESTIIEALQGLADNTFLKALTTPAPTDSKDKRTLLGKYLQKYAARNTMDYFIHKDLGGFLRRELDFYIKNEIMRLDDIENADAPQVQNYLSKIRVLRKIAQQLIAFLAQLEEFQKKLWLKKKFVTESHYCITLDRIDAKFYPEIAANQQQRLEWVKLFAINEIAGDLATPAYSEPLTVDFLAANPFLLVDTALFSDDFKQRLLAEIPNLDTQCDGVLIHSENFQALGLMQEKYREQVKCVYIDPPYNTGGDGFVYKDSYQHSSWMSFMSDRLNSGKELMQDSGILFSSIDDFESINLQKVLYSVFGEENFLLPLYIQVRFENKTLSEDSSFHKVIEQILICSKSNKAKIIKDRAEYEIDKFEWEIVEKTSGVEEYVNGKKTRIFRDGEWDIRRVDPSYSALKETWATGSLARQKGSSGEFFELYLAPRKKLDGLNCLYKVEGIGEDGLGYRYFTGPKKDSATKGKFYSGIPLQTLAGLKNGTAYKDKPIVSYYNFSGDFGNCRLEGKVDIRGGKKPEKLINQIINLSSRNGEKDIILDFYAGSGTTPSVAHKMNKKYIAIEIGDYFDDKLLARMKHTLYGNGGGIESNNNGGLLKYIRLESYEDVLNNLVFKEDVARDQALANNPDLRRDYLLNYFLDVETQNSQSLLNIADFRDPFAYQMWIKKPGSEEQTLQSIDLIETFSWLIGLWVQHSAAPQRFSAEFARETDPDLPQDQNTRLLCKRLKPEAQGEYWFKLIEGYTLKVPGDNNSKIPTLIVWRKLTNDPEKDNAVLQTYLLEKLQISPREQTYGVIYVNGSHTLPNPVIEGEQIKVRLIEEAFHAAMWSGE
jgi:adenine-specific DNA-methyltransferase